MVKRATLTMSHQGKFSGGSRAAMLDIYRRAKKEVNYHASRFLQMLEAHRGLETAKILLNAGTVSDGYVALWRKGRLDLTVEALVLTPEYRTLFETAELEVAEARLKQYGYTN